MPHPARFSLRQGARHRVDYACAPFGRENPAGYDLSAPRNFRSKNIVTIQLTSDLSDSGVKSAHIHVYIARFILVLEQIKGNLNSYG